jgi:hypothetical protein
MSRHDLRRFTPHQVRAIRADARGYKLTAVDYGVTPIAIRNIRKRRTYSDVPDAAVHPLLERVTEQMLLARAMSHSDGPEAQTSAMAYAAISTTLEYAAGVLRGELPGVAGLEVAHVVQRLAPERPGDF